MNIKDIAKALGVSVSTVSRALQDNPMISLAKRDLIQRYARDHHFVLNTAAARLRQSRPQESRYIAVVLPQFEHYYFSCILTAIELTLSAADYFVIAVQTGDCYARERSAVEALCQQRVAGIIISLAKDTTDYRHIVAAQEQGIPLVFADRICTGVRTSRVVVDDYAAAVTATEHLIACGCRRIAFLGATMNLEISKNRFNGYRDTMRRHHLAIDERLVCQCDNRAEAEALTPTLLALEPRPDGFFTINDDTALGVLYSAKRHGFNVPRDLQICGFADGIRARSCEPSLTTIEQRGDAVGREAAQVLLDTLQGRVPAGQFLNRIVKTKLVVRNTTLPPQSDKVEG
ncbi:MAG: LacI family DNA-binding transcriptional regulator [Bacteroidaceae bacterium]|nr:LacI family DNA-binding transcriptional regulator [Bacteroidaceae bacterium]